MSEMGSIIEYNEDLSEAEAPKSLPTNDYPGEIIGAELGTSQASGKPRVEVTWRIKPEDFPADYEDADAFPEGKEVKTYQGAATDKASRFRMRKFCEAIGAPLSNRLDVNSWIGKRAALSIEPETFEGIEKERVRKVEAL